MKTSLNFIKKIRGVAVALMSSLFLFMSGQALAYPDSAQASPPALTIGQTLNPTSANLISKRDKLDEFYEQPSFTFNDAVGFQSTSSTNTIQVSKSSVVGAPCQKGQLATDRIGKLLSCESGRFAEANGSAQDTATERATFNAGKAIEGSLIYTMPRLSRSVLYPRRIRIPVDMKVEFLGFAPEYSFGNRRVPSNYDVSRQAFVHILNLKKGDILSMRIGDWNASYATYSVYINGRRVVFQYRGNLNRFQKFEFGRLLDLPSLTYNPYRVVLGLPPR